MATTARLTSKEIDLIVLDYQPHLPEWKVIGGDTLMRVGGLVAQSIWFDRLRTGAYRPTARIHVLAAPDEMGGTVVLPQFLGVKHKEISAQSHLKQLPAVVEALRSEVVPTIFKPLDANVVVDLAAARSHGRPAGAYAVACLCAALGRSTEARRWIAEYHSALSGLDLPEQPIDASRSSFLCQLEAWVAASVAEIELANVAQQQKAILLSAA
jgi:hypothetical protein